MAIVTENREKLVNSIIVKLIENGLITDYNPGSVIRTIIEAICAAIGDDTPDIDTLYKQVISIYNNSRIDTAEGDSLEQLGKLVGVTRDEGSQSQGYVTCYKNSDSTTNFTIASGSKFATVQDNNETQKNFTSQSAATFFASISNEQHTFINGVYIYPLDSRFFTTVTEVRGTASAVNRIAILNTDYQVSSFNGYVVDPEETIVMLDNCDATTGWTQNEAQALTTSSDKREGTNSLRFTKTSVVNNYVYISKTITSKNIVGKNLNMFIYINNTTTLDKITSIDIYVGTTNVTNSYKYTIEKSSLVTGWNRYFPIDYIITGNPNLSDITYIQFRVNTLNANNTFASGDIGIDSICYGNTSLYEGNVIEFLPTGTLFDNNTTMYASYKPRSVEVFCTSDEIGSLQNVAKSKIVQKLTFDASMNQITSVSNYEVFTAGEDEETDDELRERIQTASQNIGKATSAALKTAIESLDYIRSAAIFDLPRKTKTNEAIVYNTGSNYYKLGFEVVYLNDDTTPTNITLSNSSGGAANYTYGTDYTIIDSQVYWLPSGTKPSNGATFYVVTYDYDWLGHCEILVSGFNSLSSTQQDEVDAVIEETKPVGVVVTWDEPTEVLVNVTAALTLKNGYTLTQDIIDKVSISISNYINSLTIGDDVIKNSIISAIMSNTEVLNCSVTLPAADTTIAADEIAKIGVITLS